MKLFFSVLASSAVALAFGIYPTHRASDPPDPGLRPSAAVETSPQDIGALRVGVALPREQVFAFAAAGNAGRAETPLQEALASDDTAQAVLVEP